MKKRLCRAAALVLAGAVLASCAGREAAELSPSSLPEAPSASSSPAASSAPEPAPLSPGREEGAAALAPLVEEICREREVMGMSLAVFDREGVFYEQSFGYAIRETGTPARADTVYRVASVSKSVTALIALDLVRQGKLSLDEPLSGLLGYPLENPAFPGEGVTLRQLLTHTSGILDSAAYEEALGQPSLPPLAPVLARSWGGYPPGTRYSYSNFAMGLVSGVIEKAAGEPFLTYTREAVFDPMGIDAAYSYTDIEDKAHVADIYQSGEKSVYMPGWWNMNAKYASLPLGQLYALGHGDLFITAGDLARFAMVMAGCPREAEPLSLTPGLLRGMQTVQYSEEGPDGQGNTEVLRGLGTQITDCLLPGKRMAGHQGNAYGTICGLFFDPEAGTGFVFLTNGASGAKDPSGLYLVNQDIARAVYGAFFGWEAPPAEEKGPEAEASAGAPSR